jgi:hypothetical protein
MDEPENKGAIDQDFKKKKIRLVGGTQKERDGHSHYGNPVCGIDGGEKEEEAQIENGC